MFFFFSILIILVVFFLITLDLLFIPTVILTLFAILGFIGYLTYVFTQWSLSHALAILGIFLGLGIIYGIIVFKFKLWRGLSFEKRLPQQSKADEQVGEVAVTLTDLKPIGLIELKNRKVDAIAINGFIAKGKEVEITGRSGAQFKVKPK